MEETKSSSVSLVRLPPGFRFHPTDEELIVQYLTRKVFSCPLPASIIPEIDLANRAPWDLLPAGSGRDRYFFALTKGKYQNGNRTNRVTAGFGYWKATGKDRAVVASRSNQVVGTKKSLVFYRGKAPNGSRTDWIMHEYRLASPDSSRACAFPQRNNSTHNLGVPPRDWVLCRIFTKKRATKMSVQKEEQEEEEKQGIGFIDFMGQDRSPNSPAGSSDLSCVTEGREELSNGENTSSYTP